ncbi:exported hypothetical protein [Mesorhizobium sp. STM 4661]|nr:exported hypothetical protein [Mesorhizobium sp. STM 4661]
MKTMLSRIPLIAFILGAVGLVGWQMSAEPTRTTFPENLDQLVHYTTVTRGNAASGLVSPINWAALSGSAYWWPYSLPRLRAWRTPPRHWRMAWRPR